MNNLSKTWDLLKPHAREHGKHLGFVLLLGVLTAVAQAASLPLIGLVFGIFFPSDQLPDVVSMSDLTWRSNPVESVGIWLGFFERYEANVLVGLAVVAGFLALISGAAMWGYTLIGRRTAYQMIVDLRVRLAEHLMGLSMRYHGQRQFGDLLSRISNDVSITLGAVNTFIRSVLMEPIKASAVLGIMVWLQPKTTFCLLVVMPIAVFPVLKLSKRVRKGSRKSLSSLGESLEALTQMFLGMRTVKSFGGEKRELERYRSLNEGFLKTSMKMVRAIALAQTWTAFYSIAGIGLMVLVIGALQINFQLFTNVGDMGTWFLMAARLNNHVKNFTKAQTGLAEASGAADRINALLEEVVDVKEVEHPAPLSGFNESLVFDSVDFTYAGSEEPAIQGLSLTLRRGETLALVGASGAGKSTLMDLVARFIDPSSGEIRVDGQDLCRASLADWTAQYAMVSQAPFLFHTSLGENIAYGKPDATQAEIEAAARAANIHDFVMGLPDGYATNASDMGARLSGGQRQRITIARAVLKGAPLLLLDEATSALDSESEAQVQAALNKLMHDRTVLVIAHRLSTIREADRIAVMEAGRIVELGSHAELLASGGTYARLHAMQNRDGNA